MKEFKEELAKALEDLAFAVEEDRREGEDPTLSLRIMKIVDKLRNKDENI